MNDPQHINLRAEDFIALIKTRRTIHLYEDRPVPNELITEAVSAAHHAPNHKLTWPWRFTLIGPEVKSKMNEFALKMKATNGPLEGSQLELFKQKRVYPQLVVVSQLVVDDPMQSKEDYAAVSCAIQNLSLALAAHGVGTKWSTGSMTRHPLAYELTNINSDEEEIVGFVWFGYPAKTPSPRRPELTQVFRVTP